MIEMPRITETEEQKAAVVRLTVSRAELPDAVPPALGELVSAIAAAGLEPQGPMFMHHLTTSEEQLNVEVGFPVERPVPPTGRVQPGRLPAATVARTVYQGPYEGLYGAWDDFGKQLESGGLLDRWHMLPEETLWESYLVGPETTPDASRWRTELNLPLKRIPGG